MSDLIKEEENDEVWKGKFKGLVQQLMGHQLVYTERPDEKAIQNAENNAFATVKLWYWLFKTVKCEIFGGDIKGVTPGNLNPVERMFIYTNIIEPVDVNEKAMRLLRMVNTRGEPFKTTHEEFTKPSYLPVEKGKFSVIEVYVSDASGKPVPFQIGTLMLMLHFRRRRKGVDFVGLY
jgi:hypothetical protein